MAGAVLEQGVEGKLLARPVGAGAKGVPVRDLVFKRHPDVLLCTCKVLCERNARCASISYAYQGGAAVEGCAAGKCCHLNDSPVGCPDCVRRRRRGWR